MTNWLWLLRGGPGQANFGLSNVPSPEAYFTLGTTNDTDADGLTDAYETLVSHTDPGSASNPDTDGDGIPDAWELAQGLNPCDGTDGTGDPDDDGMTNYEEYVAGTNPFDPMLLAWSVDSNGEVVVPHGLPGAQNMAGGGGGSSGGHTLVLTTQGGVTAWGYNGFGQTNVPGSISTNAVAVAAGGDQSAALLNDGTVVAWGREFGDVPGGLTDVTAIAAGFQHLLALRADGTVTAWGCSNSPANSVPPGLDGVKAIAAGWNHNLALRSNGTVAVWGLGGGALHWNLTNAPPGLADVAAISAGALHNVVLRSNGSVIAWGNNLGGETNVPAGLGEVTAIAAGRGYTLALRPDATVTGWGAGLPEIPSGLTGVKRIAAGPGHALAVRGGVLTPLILRQPESQGKAAGGTATFRVSAASRRAPAYQWQFNGTNLAGATKAALTLSNVQAAAQGMYRAVVTNGAGAVASAEAQFVLVLPPVILSPTNAQLVWVPWRSNLALTVQAEAQGSEYDRMHTIWYRDGEPFPDILGLPTFSRYPFEPYMEGHYWAVVTNTAGRATSAVWTVRALMPGGIVPWGDLSNGLPPSLTNCIGLCAGQTHAAALLENNTVVAWGGNGYGQNNVPAGLTNIVAVAAGAEHTLALTRSGTVIAWGRNDAGQTNVPGDLANVTGIAAGGAHSLALLSNGTVRTWGASTGAVPADLTNATAVAAGVDFNVALREGGTVNAWGDNSLGQTNVPGGLSNVVAIAAGDAHALALRSDGQVVAWGANTCGQTNVPAGLTNAMAIAAGGCFSLALRNDGTVLAWGDNSRSQTEVLTNLPVVKLIAAGGNQALASPFSSWVQYPVDVSKDLLLIYNTNSADSVWVKDYYLAHRPMVGNANVLGIDCPTDEVVNQFTFTNQILMPYLDWVAQHPTRHPHYVILFLDMPSRVQNTDGVSFASASIRLHWNTPGIRPFVTHIHLGNTNDCKGYIDKLAAIGTNAVPGQPLLSASAAGYGNTNYVVDGIRNGGTEWGPYNENFEGDGPVVFSATNGLFYAGVLPEEIFLYDGIEYLSNGVHQILRHPTGHTNVAGYICWGAHSSLGGSYPTNGVVQWTGNSGWWIIETIESSNGMRVSDQGNFIRWFAPTAFGGSNHSNTPIGAVSYVWEPFLVGMNRADIYFGLWASGKNFGMAAWNSHKTAFLQVVGDPLVVR